MYRIIEKIGVGGYGVVYKVKHMETSKHYACKITKKDNNHEMNMMLKLKHCKHIARVYEELPFGPDRSAMIMELCEHGNIQEQRPEHIHRYIDQAIQAISECHANGIIHKDIKADNFLLSADDRIKLIDFGLSEYDFGSCIYKSRGTPLYLPPEGIRFHKHYLNTLTPAYDIWSLGVLMYLLHTGEHLFLSKNTEEVLCKINRRDHIGILHKKVDNIVLRSLLFCMLSTRPDMRPDIETVRKRYTAASQS